MQIHILKSKLHRATVTGANVQYEGSLTIDSALMERAGMHAYERILCGNLANGERFETYVIKGERKTGTICLNGPAARKVQVGDVIIVISYAGMDFEEAKKWKPFLVFPDQNNRLINS